MSISVFPACAGMFLNKISDRLDTVRFPRVRGDVPEGQNEPPVAQKFSPRARGCSRLLLHHRRISTVFPACAGMFLPLRPQPRISKRFPRVRGDVPVTIKHLNRS